LELAAKIWDMWLLCNLEPYTNTTEIISLIAATNKQMIDSPNVWLGHSFLIDELCTRAGVPVEDDDLFIDFD
jgi:hypothetical protein